MAVNRTTTALDPVLADASVLRNDATLLPFKAQKRKSGRVASPSASVQVTCSSERYSDEPPLKRQKPDMKAQEKQVRQRKPPPVRLKPATKAQERRLRPLAPKLPPNAGALLNSGVPPNSGILPNFGLLNVVNSKQGAVPMSSSKPVTLLLLCKPVRPDTSQTSLLKPASDAGRQPGITIVTSDESGVVYTTVTRVGNKEANSDTSSNAMSAHVKESTGETEIIGIPSVNIGVKQCMSSNHEKRASAACNSVVLSTTRKLATDPAHTTGIACASVTENDALELCNAGATPVKEMSSSSEPLMVAMPTPNFHLEHCEPEEGHAPGISAPRRTMLGAGECVAGALTMISNLREQTGILRSMLMKAEKASELNTSSITSPGSAKGCAAEPAIIGIPTVNIDTEHMSETGEKQAFTLCSPGKIKLEPPEYTECEMSFSGDPSEDNNMVLNPLPTVQSTLHASCISTNATLSPVVESRSKLAAFGVTRDASDVEHKTSTVVIGQASSPPAQSSITSFPARDAATKPTVNGIPSDKTALFCCQLKLVKDEVFELCAPSSDTDVCANDANDCATNSAGSDVPPESSVVEHSVSTAVQSRTSTSYSSCNAISSAMKRTSSNISVLAVCNEKTSNAPSTMRIPECFASLPRTSSNTTSELETHMDDSNSDSLRRSMPRSSTPSSPATTFRAKMGSLKNPLNYFKKELSRSLHSSERTKEIVHALKHTITAPQSKVMFYREKVNSLKLQFHNAQRIMKQPLTEDFGMFAMSVPRIRVTDGASGCFLK